MLISINRKYKTKMSKSVLRKFLVVLIIIVPVISYSGCKKQAKCGCGKDVLFTFTKEPAAVYFNDSGTTISLTLPTDAYSTYSFCNPSEMWPKIKANYKYGEVIQVSGHVYWDCNYLYQASNSSYQTYMKQYLIQVTDVTLNLYGKK